MLMSREELLKQRRGENVLFITTPNIGLPLLSILTRPRGKEQTSLVGRRGTIEPVPISSLFRPPAGGYRGSIWPC